MSSNAHEPEDRPVLRGFRSTVGRESTTFGFSILITVTFGLLQTLEGSPDVPRIFLFAVGAVMSFTVLEGALSKGFRTAMPQHHTQVQSIGAGMNVLSVLAGLGVAWLVGSLTSHVAVWGAAPFLAAVAYLVAESLETVLAERLLVAKGHPQATDVSP